MTGLQPPSGTNRFSSVNIFSSSSTVLTFDVNLMGAISNFWTKDRLMIRHDHDLILSYP